jgi:hypothetical protein
MEEKEIQINEDLFLNTNEIIHDYQFYFQMIVERRKMDFENIVSY